MTGFATKSYELGGKELSIKKPRLAFQGIRDREWIGNVAVIMPVSFLAVIIVVTTSKAGISRDGRSPCLATSSLTNGAWKV